jgi:rhamnogalacturonyl hydrolase YesR
MYLDPHNLHRTEKQQKYIMKIVYAFILKKKKLFKNKKKLYYYSFVYNITQ